MPLPSSENTAVNKTDKSSCSLGDHILLEGYIQPYLILALGYLKGISNLTGPNNYLFISLSNLFSSSLSYLCKWHLYSSCCLCQNLGAILSFPHNIHTISLSSNTTSFTFQIYSISVFQHLFL